MYGIDLIHVGWASVIALAIGYLWGKHSGIKEEQERAAAQMNQQIKNAAYMQAMQEIARRVQ